jgi:hypothetical protein
MGAGGWLLDCEVEDEIGHFRREMCGKKKEKREYLHTIYLFTSWGIHIMRIYGILHIQDGAYERILHIFNMTDRSLSSSTSTNHQSTPTELQLKN